MTAPGTLEIESSAARRCVQACATLSQRLDVIRRNSAGHNVDGAFGVLDSGKAIAHKYQQKLDGSEGSLAAAIASHIEVLRELQAVFEASAQAYVGTEAGTTSSLAGLGGSA